MQRIKKDFLEKIDFSGIPDDFSTKLSNILDEQFNLEHPDAVWVSDITYIWTFDGFVYLTSIMDLYSRKIIAWVLSETLEAAHVVECIEKAKKIRKTVMNDIDTHLRTRLRVIIWKQWKVPGKRQWGLQKLGIGKDLAKQTAYMGDHYQWLVTKTCVARAISKEKLSQAGLVSCYDYYMERPALKLC